MTAALKRTPANSTTMSEPVSITLSAGTWWLVGAFALIGVIMCALEAYWLAIETAHDIRHRLTRRHDA